MLNTYHAILRGHILEWLYDAPQDLPTDRAIAVHVTILDKSPQAIKNQQGNQMALALEQLAKRSASALGGLDAIKWEREVR